MRHSTDNGIKDRLTEPSEMVAEVKRLLSSGIKLDQVPAELSQLYYIDVDLLNAVLRVVRKHASTNAARAGSASSQRPDIGSQAAA
ncbi:hypothetical protein [uncultured Nitratireductor sp.]|uniref:hypothetical protein n=1 Tax=uncultured Nitratireductor sp. TaxID=520953 RepID=UPI00260B6DCB|nr:hypothetical protein [uncultured Nitratireductor sp.]